MLKGQWPWDVFLKEPRYPVNGCKLESRTAFPKVQKECCGGGGGQTAWGAVSWLAAIPKGRSWHFSLQGSPESEDIQS